jgi:hypothetical protein
MRQIAPYVVLPLSLLLSSLAIAIPDPMPQASRGKFLSEGWFQGGTGSRATLRDLHLSFPSGNERWTLEFSDLLNQRAGKVAPRFQLRYFPSERGVRSDGSEAERSPARLVFWLRSLERNHWDRSFLRHLLKQSELVKNIVLYPPIEEGDMALEFVFRENVLFEPHEPVAFPGRVILDFKAVPPEDP